MPFPVIPAALVGIASLIGWAIFSDDKTASKTGPSPSPGPSPVPIVKKAVVMKRVGAATGPTPVKGKMSRIPKGAAPIPPPAPKPIPPPPPVPPAPVPPAPTPPAPTGTAATVTAPSGLNVRSKPDASSSALALLANGTRVTLTEPGNVYPATAGAPKGWLKITTASGIVGFGSAEWLTTGSVPAPVPVGQASGVVTAQSGLNVRSKPDASGGLLTTVPMGGRVNILEPGTTHPPTAGAPVGWFHVQAPNGVIGYASAQYIMFGSAKELAMTDEEFKAYNERKSQGEARIYGEDTGSEINQASADYALKG